MASPTRECFITRGELYSTTARSLLAVNGRLCRPVLDQHHYRTTSTRSALTSRELATTCLVNMLVEYGLTTTP